MINTVEGDGPKQQAISVGGKVILKFRKGIQETDRELSGENA
jgi:hypothetical protein